MTDLEEAKRHIEALCSVISLGLPSNRFEVYERAQAFLSRLDGEGQTVEGGDDINDPFAPWPKVDAIQCSFCGKEQDDVAKIVAGPVASICNECVGECLPITHPELTRLRAEQCDRRTVLEEAARACEQQAADFLSPQYAVGQPASSFSERFACKQCAEAIRALKDQTEGSGG